MLILLYKVVVHGIFFKLYASLSEAAMLNPAGETTGDVFIVDFDRRLMVQFRGSVVAGLLAYRKFDDALGLSVRAGDEFADVRTGRNGRMRLLACCGSPYSGVSPVMRL